MKKAVIPFGSESFVILAMKTQLFSQILFLREQECLFLVMQLESFLLELKWDMCILI